MKIDKKIMYRALLNKDKSFEGCFWAGIKTTGIFCRPTCKAKKPKEQNVEYFLTTKEALFRGYRPCKMCKPMLSKGQEPDWVKKILNEVHQNRKLRFKDFEIKKLGINPNRLRRWFKENHSMTFQAYLRALRLTGAIGMIGQGEKIIETAYNQGYESLSGFNEAFKKSFGVSPKKIKSDNPHYVSRILTPLGPMIICANNEGISLLEFADRRMLETQFKRLQKYFDSPMLLGSNKHILQAKNELKEYFEGTRKSFDVALCLKGTSFQEKVWKLLLTIPYGQVRSYKQQAEALKNPKAIRAVATANGDNRIAIIVPCHRVIGSNGKLVGYAGGLSRKKYLLELENSEIEYEVEK